MTHEKPKSEEMEHHKPHFEKVSKHYFNFEKKINYVNVSKDFGRFIAPFRIIIAGKYYIHIY